ncbi:response regulator [Chitinophagaceae bacterium LB-8]|uniref:Response regulator n=1 Tax=Paraflavisolibacter caeni TaxID=2982496 RepID=A0A9X2XXI1_9BACT|nr:response regulator [Paraflavisolibacter caeni]MCU7551329.1 response regulator [Paraflavisolibacter caeni]
MEKQYHAILLVDDDEDDLHILSSTLKQMGSSYEILQAHDGADALTQLRQLSQSGELPSLIIMDINMPKMDGKQTLTAIKADDSLSGIPIVIFSTSSSEVDKLFFKTKNVEMITKPVEFKTFYDVAAKLLSYRKSG